MKTAYLQSSRETFSITYLPQLDTLRFIAATLVFFHHCAAIPGLSVLKQMGWIGVDLFLLLSSLLLTKVIRSEIDKFGTLNIRNFFVRRALRIWPLFFTYTFSILIWQTLKAGEFQAEATGQFLTHLFFINNITTAAVGYGNDLPFTSHLWTISLEEQFYLIVPFIVPAIVAYARPGRWPLIIFPLLLMAGIRASCIMVGVEHPFVWVLWFRFDSVILGIALGSGLLDRFLQARCPWAFYFIGVAMVTSTMFLPPIETGGWEQVYTYTTLDVGLTLVVISVLNKNFLSRLLSIGPFPYLGRISYGFYVLHLLMIGVFGPFRAETLSDSVLNVLTAYLATLVGAIISYELFEKWFLKWKKRFQAGH